MHPNFREATFGRPPPQQNNHHATPRNLQPSFLKHSHNGAQDSFRDGQIIQTRNPATDLPRGFFLRSSMAAAGDYEFYKEVQAEEGKEYQYKFRVGEQGDWWMLNEESPTGMCCVGLPLGGNWAARQHETRRGCE
jgi:hypothetical protein